jgi:hypothetical protein
MAARHFDRLGTGALRHHAFLVRIDRPVNGGHPVPAGLGLPCGIRNFMRERVHTCVEATVRFAAELGYEVTVVKMRRRVTRLSTSTPPRCTASQQCDSAVGNAAGAAQTSRFDGQAVPTGVNPGLSDLFVREWQLTASHLGAADDCFWPVLKHSNSKPLLWYRNTHVQRVVDIGFGQPAAARHPSVAARMTHRVGGRMRAFSASQSADTNVQIVSVTALSSTAANCETSSPIRSTARPNAPPLLGSMES